MKPGQFFVIILIVASVVAGLVSFVLPINSKHIASDSVAKEEQKELEEELIVVNPTSAPKVFEPLAVAVPFASYRKGLEFEDLELERLVASKEVADELDRTTDLTVVAVSEQELSSELEEGSVALLLPHQVSPKHKTLYIDGQHIWQKGFSLDTYPLVVEVEQREFSWSNATKLEVFSAGEIIPARAVDRLSLNVNNNYTYLYDFFAEDILEADVSIALLENPLEGNPTPCTGCTVFVGDEQNAEGLETVGFDLLSLAGNHAGDGGESALARTIELFNDSPVDVAGVGNSKKEALVPAIKEVNGTRIGMIAADDIAYFYWAQNEGEKLGINSFSVYDNGINTVDANQLASVKGIKAANNLDILIAYMSWGIEYTNLATNYQKEVGHILIDNGVDVIVGSHPHWVQNIEFYQGKPILYSLGNFLFDQTHTDETRQAVAAKLFFYNSDLKFIELLPMQACGYHQTQEDLTQRYLSGELTKQMVYDFEDSNGCVYWQPKKLEPEHLAYNDILGRIYEHTSIDLSF